MKALFFLNAFAGGGAEKACLNLAKQLYKMDIESDFVTIYDTRADYDIPGYIHEFSLGLNECASFIKTFRSVMQGVHKVNQFISDQEYVLITAHLRPAEFLASLTKVGNKCLYVMHISQHLEEKYNKCRIYRIGVMLFLKGKKIVTVSRGLKDELMYECKVIPKDVTVINNPGDVKQLLYRRKSVTPHKRPYILFMGRLEKSKNPLLALELYYRGKFYKRYDLVYLGQGSLECCLRNKVAEYHMEKHVYLAGFQKHTARWLENAELLLSSSGREGLPMNLIEALACGTPVVAADCPYGPNEIMTGELAKYLIYPDKDIDKSISVIWSALKSYPKITKRYYEKFDDALITQKYLDVWSELFAQKEV